VIVSLSLSSNKTVRTDCLVNDHMCFTLIYELPQNHSELRAFFFVECIRDRRVVDIEVSLYGHINYGQTWLKKDVAFALSIWIELLAVRGL